MKRLAAVLASLACALSCAAAADLRPFDATTPAMLQKAHAGRPFVLAFWSVTCEPCRHDMPHWAPLRRRFPDVAIVLVSTDPPSDRALVTRVLAQYDLATVELRMISDEYAERVRYAIDPRWRGELPRTYLYDASHEAQAISGVLDPKELGAWLERNSGRRR